jgi:hypothetical protein
MGEVRALCQLAEDCVRQGIRHVLAKTRSGLQKAIFQCDEQPSRLGTPAVLR